jgi:iron complex outermembrane receptor protein
MLKSIGIGVSVMALAVATNVSEARAQSTPPAESGNVQAPAQKASDTGDIGDIVVTAQKRSESLQRVPLAVTAMTTADLDRSAITSLQGVATVVPNLNLGQQLGVAKVALRGIGLENISAGAEGSIAFHLDGVFVSRSIAALASFYDVAQVEVLRGPQGTLYGRNATGGSINITTKSPTEEFSGYVNLNAGNYSRFSSEGAVSGAIVPGILSARIAYRVDTRGGYGKNIISGHDVDDLNSRATRGKLLFTPNDALTIELGADYYWEKDNAGANHYIGPGGFTAPGVQRTPTGLLAGGTVSPNVRDVASDLDPRTHITFWGTNGKISYDFGNGMELRSTTGYRRTKYNILTDLDSTSAYLTPETKFEDSKQFSEELQLTGKNGRLNWILGAFYFYEKDAGGIRIPFNNLIVGRPAPGTFVQGYFSGGYIKTSALAFYGQADYELFDNFKLTLGARYSTEKKSDYDESMFDTSTPYDPTLPLTLTTRRDEKRFNSFTPRIAINYQATPDVMLYASWAKGFKSGTYNLGALRPPVDPEKVDAWEAGVKSTMLGRRLRVNLAGFYYDYTGLQVGKVRGTTLVLENAATARIYGLEAEVRANVGPRIELNANGAWLHARFKDYISGDPARPFGDGTTVDPDTGGAAFNLSGNTLSQSPNFTFNAGAQYNLPTGIGDFSLRGEVIWRDRTYYTPFNLEYVSQAPNTKINAFLNWESMDKMFKASVYAKNITNRTTLSNSYVSTGLVGSPVNAYLEEPRTYGVTFGVTF